MSYAVSIRNEYFEWMLDIVQNNDYSEYTSYRKLLNLLHNIPFRYSIQKDENRAGDGIDLRYRFAYETKNKDAELYLRGACSVLEMLLALALRCEETIMDDPKMGNRTSQWFWGMIVNLGLGSMINLNFDSEYANDKITKFLDRDYAFNGKGGLFTIRDRNCDIRTVEIWCQLCWYLDSIS